MKKFFKKAKQLEHKHLRELAALCAGMMLLILAAVFVAEGGMSRVNHVLAMYGITQESQTGCIFPCNNTAYSLQALIPMQGGVPVSTVQPGTAVDWIWNAGAYGANNFNPACRGRSSGYWYDCSVTINTPDTARLAANQCSYAWTETGSCAEYACSGYDKYGNCAGSTCVSYYPDVYHPSTGCGNADIYFGWNTYGPSGGYPPNYASPGYAGNTPGTMIMTAPSTPGNYTYYLCSAFLIWYAPAGAGQGCLGTTLTVASPPPTCSLTPSTQTIVQGSPATFTYSTSNATAVTYRVDGGAATAPAGNPFTVSGLAIGTHGVIMTVTGPGGNATCGSASNVVVTAPAAPSCAVSSFGSPWNSTSYLIYSGGQGSISNWYGRYCVHNYSGAALFIPMATPTEWNNFVARAAALSIGVAAY